MSPLVSVVIASRNYGRFLAGAVRSVLGQTFADLEVLVIDDGSTDDTPAVLRPFLADPRVRAFRTDGLGQSRAKNLGILHARGRLVAFLDGDDEWHCTKLERQLPLFADPAVGVVYCRRTLMDAAGRDLPAPTGPLDRGFLYDTLLVRNPVCFSSAVVRKGVFEAVGLFDPNLPLAIDYDLWLRVAPHFAFDFADEPLVRYRTGHGNLSSRITERLAAVLAILRRSLVRRQNAEQASPVAQSEAWGSTYRTLGFVVRRTNALAAAGWYLRAAWHDRRWGASVKAALGGFGRRLVSRRPSAG